MKIGILGDIHGNDIALKKILNKAKNKNVVKLLITGDLIGYYYNISEIFSLLKEWDWISVRGNHEDMLKKSINNKKYLNNITSKYGSSIKIALKELTKKQINFLTSLPHPFEIKIDGKKILLCHGSPSDLNFYVYPDCDNKILKEISKKNHDLIILGHTHYPMHRQINSTTIINPGSVGQPRNKQKGAQWALYDTKNSKLDFYVEKYNPNKIIKQVMMYDPENEYLYNILKKI